MIKTAVSFCEMSKLCLKYLNTNYNYDHIIFNGSFIRSSVTKTIDFLRLLKNENIICIRNETCYRLCNALNDQGEFSETQYDRQILTTLKKKYKDFSNRKIQTYVFNTYRLIESLNDPDLSNLFYTKSFDTFSNICFELREASHYYHKNSLSYLIRNKHLYLGEFGKFNENFNIYEKFVNDTKFPITIEIFNFFEELTDERFETIVVPMRKFTDYGLTERIGNYQLISTATKSRYHFDGLGQIELNNTPLCFYDENKIFGISSTDMDFSYEPQPLKVCVVEDVNNTIVYYFRILEAKYSTLWYRSDEKLIFYTVRGSSPKNLRQYDLLNILEDRIIVERERYRNEIYSICSPICSPISSPI